jgi:hypothetical protein
MKTAFVSLLRLTMLVGVLVLLPHLDTGLKAQYGNSTCATFTSDPSSPCPTCCTVHNEIPGQPYETVIDHLNPQFFEHDRLRPFPSSQ